MNRIDGLVARQAGRGQALGRAGRWMLAGLLVATVSVGGSPAAGAAEVVGTAARVFVWAYSTPPGGTRKPLFVRDSVVMGAVLETVPEGGLHVRFLDDSEIRLGPESRLTIDTFVYDPAAGRESASVRLGVGILRFVSGRMRSDGVSIDSPVAGIGLRGTDLVVDVAADGTTYVAVDVGRAVVTARTSGASETVSTGQAVVVSADGRTVVRAGPRLRPPSLGFAPGRGFPSGDGGGGDGGVGSSDSDSSGSSGGGTGGQGGTGGPD